MKIESFTFTKDEFEDNLDDVKAVIVSSLVRSNLLLEEDADKWCSEHTIIIKKKSLFRSFIQKIKKEPEEYQYLVVKKI